MLRKAIVPGLALFGFAALLCFPPSCKAQEPNPDHFSDKGVETFSGARQTAKPAVKADNKTQVAAKQTNLTQPTVRSTKTSRSSSKKSASSASGK
jgi:hypothetical protein